jgi:hypothetical protein
MESVTGWDISGPTGTLFIISNGSGAIALTTQGSVTSFSPGATGVCQWGAKGALACVPGSGRVEIFNGTLVTSTFSGISIGSPNPVRIASTGRDYAMVIDTSGVLTKINDTWTSMWNLSVPSWTNVDVKTTSGPQELGRVTYLCSVNGIKSYRDMLSSGVLYGQTTQSLSAGRSPSPYPVVAVVPELETSHVWIRKTAISE